MGDHIPIHTADSRDLSLVEKHGEEFIKTNRKVDDQPQVHNQSTDQFLHRDLQNRTGERISDISGHDTSWYRNPKFFN